MCSKGNAGYLKYQDTSTGQLLCEHRTKLGSCTTMAQNLHNAVIHLGHQNGCVTLWTPNLPHPAVQLLAHLGPVSSVSVDPSSGGRYMATAGKDGTVKVWDCRNWKGAVREWSVRGSGSETEVEWSQRGYLSVASGGTVNVRALVADLTTFFCLPMLCPRFMRPRQFTSHFTITHNHLYISPTQYHIAHSRLCASRRSRMSSPLATMQEYRVFLSQDPQNQISTLRKLIHSRVEKQDGRGRSRVSSTKYVPTYITRPL